ncbi:MAG: ABC transporter substrate-binding protein, partial [Ignavibacteriae bacterium]|nr:ABC transporter substrate-binding protein [Ignavibacteriota bacterium]
DGLRYTFNIRTDVRFHDDPCFKDGKVRKLTSKDFKYCLERVNNPSTKTRGMWVFRDKIKGAREYIESFKTKNGNDKNGISGLTTPDDSTLVIELYEPFAPFLSLLTMTYGYVYPREAVEYYGNNFGQHPVGTGPFKFNKWNLDRLLVLERNKNYYEFDSAGIRLPYLDEIHYTFTQSVETEFFDFIGGKYDYHEPSAETIDALSDDNGNLIKPDEKDYRLVRQPWLNTVYFIMIQNESLPAAKQSPFLSNKKLRQALNYAVDRERIVKYVLKNRGIPAHNGPLPVGIPGYDSSTKGYKYDLKKAKELLGEAGYEDGKGLDLKLVISNDEMQKSIAIAVQEQLKETGIELKIEQVLQATLNTKQQDGEYAFTRGNWGADYYDPENFMALFYSKNIIPRGPNKTGYSNKTVDTLYEKSIRITDFEERKKIYNEMERIVIDDAAWVYLFYNQRIYLLQNDVHGFYLDGLNNIVLKYTRKN